MRKTLTILLAVAALSAVAQPAAADTTATFSSNHGDTWVDRGCTTVWQDGTMHAYGAWGLYIDGCTVSLTCTYISGCRFGTGAVGGSLQHYWRQPSQYSTCNSTLWIYTAPWRSLDGTWHPAYVRWRRDVSSSGGFTCFDSHTSGITLPTLSYGESATVQTNGVRNNMSNYARINSYVELDRL